MISPVYLPGEPHLLQEAFPDMPAPLFCRCSQSTSLLGFTFLFYDYSYYFFKFSLEESCVSLYRTAKWISCTYTYIPSVLDFLSLSFLNALWSELSESWQGVWSLQSPFPVLAALVRWTCRAFHAKRRLFHLGVGTWWWSSFWDVDWRPLVFLLPTVVVITCLVAASVLATPACGCRYCL